MSDNDNLLLSEIQTLLRSLTPEKLTDLALMPNIDLFEQISTLNDKYELENIGKTMNGFQFLDILSHYPHGKLEEKISPLLVGLKQEIFEEVLLKSSDKQLNVLKLEGFSEAMLHHLFLLIHRLEEDSAKLFHILNAIEAKIDAIDPQLTTQDEVLGLRKSLDECFSLLDLAIDKIQRTLAITWSTGNLNLIEQLNRLNSSLQRVKKEVMGFQHFPASGLYALLVEKLYSSSLHDDDPALEGLAAFSVWYLEDYQEVGLLPKDTKLALDSNRHTEEECYEYRENLFEQVKNNLKKIGLHTVKDIKKERVFSRNSLKSYISSQKTTPNH